MSFTIEMVDDIRSKAKTGADYPSEVQALKSIGVVAYDYHVETGITHYFSKERKPIQSKSNGLSAFVSEMASREKLQHILKIHQAGQTDFPTFCKQAGEAGVYKWVADLTQMNVKYVDKMENIIIEESIPAPK